MERFLQDEQVVHLQFMVFLLKNYTSSLASFGDLRQTINRNKFKLTSEDCAKPFANINKMPWEYANYQS